MTVVVAGWASGHQGWAGKRRGVHPLTAKGVHWQCRGRKKGRGGEGAGQQRLPSPVARPRRACARPSGGRTVTAGLPVAPRGPLPSSGELLRPVRAVRLSFVWARLTVRFRHLHHESLERLMQTDWDCFQVKELSSHYLTGQLLGKLICSTF